MTLFGRRIILAIRSGATEFEVKGMEVDPRSITCFTRTIGKGTYVYGCIRTSNKTSEKASINSFSVCAIVVDGLIYLCDVTPADFKNPPDDVRMFSDYKATIEKQYDNAMRERYMNAPANKITDKDVIERCQFQARHIILRERPVCEKHYKFVDDRAAAGAAAAVLCGLATVESLVDEYIAANKNKFRREIDRSRLIEHIVKTGEGLKPRDVIMGKTLNNYDFEGAKYVDVTFTSDKGPVTVMMRRIALLSNIRYSCNLGDSYISSNDITPEEGKLLSVDMIRKIACGGVVVEIPQ